MKILFVMDRRVNAGSIQAVTNYVRAGDQLGHTVALFGRPDPNYPCSRFSTDADSFDHVVFIVESALGWMSGLRLPRILASVPRQRRAVLDADGMYNPAITIDGYDRNYASEHDRLRWLAFYETLADKIMQPTLTPGHPGVIPLPFYGYDLTSRFDGHLAPQKRFDLIHVGHNWWRWKELSSRLLPAIERIRHRIARICFVGSWWDAVPPWAGDLNLHEAFRVDPARLSRAGIEVRPAVPYTQVITVMSEGRVNIMTQRPLLNHLRFLTSKYFEVFCADTIPLLMLDPNHAQTVYGPAGRELALGDGIEHKLLDMLSEPEKYRQIVEEVRGHLVAHHSYRNRVCELVEALQS